jgi:hypothetical protein
MVFLASLALAAPLLPVPHTNALRVSATVRVRIIAATHIVLASRMVPSGARRSRTGLIEFQ